MDDFLRQKRRLSVLKGVIKMTKIALVVFGILVIFLMLLASAVVLGVFAFKQKVEREVTQIFAHCQAIKPEIVTEADIAHLPRPVQRWLRHSQVVGAEKAIAVRLKQRGFFRQKIDGPWIPFEALEYFTTDAPAFLWYTTMKPSPLFFITGRDRYYQGTGNMLIKLMALLTVADARGPEIDQGTLLRYLNETMWFPSAALNDYVKWDAVDDNSAKAIMSYQGVTASAIFYFDEEGRLINMVAERYREVDGQFSLDTWSTPLSDYGEFNGIRVPTKGEGVWKLSSGDFAYIRVEVIDIEYNKPSLY